MSGPIRKVMSGLRAEVGGEEPVIRYRDPFKTLIATILSARTRDENTMMVSKKLFNVYETPQEMAEAPLPKLEALVRSSGFYKVKAKRIRDVSQQLVREYDGKTPDNLEDLCKLTGVGRKTANCVLVYAYGKPAIPVDTHVHRMSNRLGWVATKHPEKTETELEQLIPKDLWIELNNLMVKFGRSVCLPRRPKCSKCGISKYCARVGVEESQ